jgi:hypothetical protein
MSKPTKEEIKAAVEKIAADAEPYIEEAKADIETQAAENVWPLLVGALLVGVAVGGVAAWLVG